MSATRAAVKSLLDPSWEGGDGEGGPDQGGRVRGVPPLAAAVVATTAASVGSESSFAPETGGSKSSRLLFESDSELGDALASSIAAAAGVGAFPSTCLEAHLKAVAHDGTGADGGRDFGDETRSSDDVEPEPTKHRGGKVRGTVAITRRPRFDLHSPALSGGPPAPLVRPNRDYQEGGQPAGWRSCR